MATIISVINDKGGVAKTTTVINLGTALWLLGKKVLLIDTDMQCNLTVTLDKTAMNTDENLMSWIMGPRDAEPPTYERYPGFDYIPSSPNIKDLENYLRDKSVGGDRYLGIRLEGIKHHYDYILIDCAPGCTSMINTNAMEASDYILIPMRSDLYSVTGRTLMKQHIEDIRDFGYDLKVLGILLTQFDNRTEMGKMVKEHYKRQDDMPLIPIGVRKCEDINKAPVRQMSIFEYNASAPAADDYMRIAEHILGITVRKKTWTPSTWSNIANKAHAEFLRIQEEGIEDTTAVNGGE